MAETFGPYALSRDRAQVLFKGTPLTLDATAVRILTALIDRAGAPLTGAALMADARGLWDAVASLNQTLAGRGADAGYIEHHASIGFSLVVPAPKPSPSAPRRRLAPVFGRAECIARISAQIPVRRFITVVGPGGMGKTTLALAVADVLSPSYADGVCFLDLAPLTEGRLLPDALAAALGLPAAGGADFPAYLRTRQMLIVLDSCEHLVGAAAALVESFLSGAPQVHVLATSREPLRAMGEWLHRLGPMQLPGRSDGITAAEASSYPGVQLFIERASSAPNGEFTLTDALAPTVVNLCIRLDGIPLAIELAAARVELLGIHGVAAQVEDRLLLMAGGRRTATRRHRTLEAMLDWSYDLLSPDEQAVLRRLSVFRGNFTLASASAVAGNATEVILDLAAKSLVSAAATDGAPTFRLLDTTRVYAAAKLTSDPDRAAVFRAHAVCMRDLLTDAEITWQHMTRRQWRTTYAPWVNDVRAALDWAFAAGGDEQLGLELTGVAFALADQTALMTEYSEAWIGHALKVLPRLPPQPPLLELRLRILPAFVHQRKQTVQPTATAKILNALKLAEASAEPKYQAGPLVALWALSFQVGDYPQTMQWSQRASDVGRAGADPLLELIGKRTAAQTRHFMGRHREAHRLADEVLASASEKIPLVYLPSPVDSGVSMRIVLARSLWIQGLPDQAAAMADECLDFAGSDSALPLCQSLAMAAVPIALWRGDRALSRRRNDQLREHATAYSFSYWQPWWEAFDEVLALQNGDEALWPANGVPANAGTAKLRDHLGTFDAGLASPETMLRVRAATVGWCAPEVLRAQGEATRSEALLREALDLAHEQGALSWELRAASSLAKLWGAEGRRQPAHAMLADVRKRFTEGFLTADLIHADALLLDLAP